jgi:hypothetical protein
MNSTIRFTVKRIDGTAEPFSANPFSTLVEVMGIDSLENTHVFKNGRLVNKYMTLTHEKITDGSVLFAAKQAPAKAKRHRARLLPMSWLALEMAFEDMEEDRERERARISDVIWSGWEMSRNHDRMLSIMRQKQAPALPENPAGEPEPLNLERESEIQTTPLPGCWGEHGP